MDKEPMPSSLHLESGNVGREVDVMTTSNIPPRSRAIRPLRLRMAPVPGASAMDGGWWPRSRELVFELGELVDHLPVVHGPVVCASFSPADPDEQLTNGSDSASATTPSRRQASEPVPVPATTDGVRGRCHGAVGRQALARDVVTGPTARESGFNGGAWSIVGYAGKGGMRE